jgi:peptide/nickel transport system permease protein
MNAGVISRGRVTTGGGIPWLAGGCLLALGLAVILGPLVTSVDYQEQAAPILLAPQRPHWLGTDDLGRDVLVRLLYAGRVSLAVGIAAALAAALVGTAVGLTAGACGGWVDSLLMRLTDMFLALPVLPVLLILSAVDLEKPLSLLQVAFPHTEREIVRIWLMVGRLVGVVALFSWMGTARLVRAQVLGLRQSQFVLAARAAGVKGWQIGLRHLLPHCLGPILVATSAAVAGNILYEAILGFLGLGIPPPMPSWGGMLQNARAYSYYRAPWLVYFPGLCITATVLCVNIVADRLHELWDPRR